MMPLETMHDVSVAMAEAGFSVRAERVLSAQPVRAEVLAAALEAAERRGVMRERRACTAIARDFGDIKHGHVPADGIDATREASRQIANAIQYRLD